LNATVAPAQTDFLRPKGVDGWRQGLVLALAAHGLLLLALMLNMSWRTHRVEVVEAEMWSEVPRAAQPVARVVPPPPAPAPEPAPEPSPVPPTPVPEPIPQPKAVPEPAPKPEPKPADISTERKPKAEPPKKTKPPKEYFEPDPEPVKKRLAEAKSKPEPKPEPKKAETKPTPKAEAKPVVKPEAKPAPVSPQQAAQQERERQERLKRMMADLGGEGTPSAGPSVQYAGRIKARIKPNLVFTEEVSNNPLASVEVRCAPNGRIIGRRLLTKSGNTAWDEAVLLAIDRTEVLPLDEKGRIPAIMQIDFRPRDF
jgi:colicin import membrane protein